MPEKHPNLSLVAPIFNVKDRAREIKLTVGWIKLHRKIKDWEWYQDINTCWLFNHLLLTVNIKKGKYMGYNIPAGSRVIGLKALAKQTPLTISKLRTSLKKLEKSENITIKSTNKFSIISIVKWTEYQTDSKPIANQSQTDSKPIATSKEDNNIRMKELKNIYAISEELWSEFKTLRKNQKAQITNRIMKSIKKEAEKINWNVEQAITEMCDRGWRGFKSEWINNNIRKGNKNYEYESQKSKLQRETDELLASFGD